ncbi:MAG: dihydropteroate synthase [Syntrophales bacterium]|jgi:5-methyltetrahydrofolate--homocysteine methyltransferase|nr:dihydropteroate synthase [Syntrophales bacterium]MCK9527050.1 dihydropteroate synthase [Syntrophales bacterium]MDX9921825.1 dihydropteroate synthase [Syntrophales bacterium]
MIIIGEKINASIPSTGEAIRRRDTEFLARLARDQDEAGADFIDVNAGDSRDADSSPADIMRWLVGVVREATTKPLCIDSDDPAVLQAGIDACRGEEVLINSVSAEEDRLREVGRIARRAGARVIALVMRDRGIPRTVKERLEAADVIVGAFARLGLAEEQILFDPLVLPASVDASQAGVTLRTIESLKERYPAAGTVMGLSNISYGLPARGIVNRSFLLMAAAVGLDAAILNPLDRRLMSLVTTADLLTGRDPRCKRFTKAFRRGDLVE